MSTITRMRREICQMVNTEMDDRLVQQVHTTCRHLIQQYKAEAFANYANGQPLNNRKTKRKRRDKRRRKSMYKRRKRIREQGAIRYVDRVT